MDRKELRFQERFKAQSEDKKKSYMINVYRTFIIITFLSGEKRECAGLFEARTDEGFAVNMLDVEQGKYQIVNDPFYLMGIVYKVGNL